MQNAIPEASRKEINNINMKKFIIFAFALIAVQGIFAGNNKGSQVTTYYGEEASNDPNNPCKGATYRVCATITTKVDAASTTQCHVTRTLTDTYGAILYQKTTLEAGTVKQITEKYSAIDAAAGGFVVGKQQEISKP